MSPRPSAYVLLERVSNLLRAELRSAGAADELEPVHLQALDYLDRANAYSNTPLAVAEYLGLTKGNVSQRLIALERAGYLKRTADARDRRVSHLALTAKGRSLLRAAVPPPHWREALAALPAESVDRLERGLLDLLRALQLAQGGRSFGECRTCRHFVVDGGRYACGLTREPLAAEQTTKICREHAAPELPKTA
ncbi:MAG: MarR family transcriptional regulator [Steroidobacteraceae bacterium]|jgi:DNA-binding MarR family transcriptional regulator|nr:MarR family transcriptional regulator [Steroidobacteraceae bacterium]